MTLGELVERGVALEVFGPPETVVTGVRHDSREVEPGDLFVAIRGESSDGSRFAQTAIERGAAAIAAEARLPLDVPQIEVSHARRALALLAREVYGHPTHRLDCVGITGTNGKTSVAWIVDAVIRAEGWKCALLGTVESRVGGVRVPSKLTTPEGDEVQRLARAALDDGATHMVMEVSSHALSMYRVDGVHFTVAAFTNLSQDHLDFHPDMESYFEAKARLFEELEPDSIVVNVDDAYGARLAARLPRAATVGRTGAFVRLVSSAVDASGITACVETLGEQHDVHSSLYGAHNLENLLVAVGVMLTLGFSSKSAAETVFANAVAAPGRMERVDGLEGVPVIVDYAHTPDALTRVISAMRALTQGRVIVVFGCGGDRDAGKRPMMGEAAARGADVVVVTSDNPRTEDPHEILRAIEPGVARCLTRDDRLIAPGAYTLIEDRRAAIEAAVRCARPGDAILIAGKGHEDYQIRGTEKLDFDDRVEARRAIERRLAEAN